MFIRYIYLETIYSENLSVINDTKKYKRSFNQHRLLKPTLYEKRYSDPTLHLLWKDFIINVSCKLNVDLGEMYEAFSKIFCRGPGSCWLNVGLGEM